MYVHPRYGTIEAFIGILLMCVGLMPFLSRIRFSGRNSK